MKDLSAISAMARAYLAKHICGGSLHIVLEDGNVEDMHVRWCEGYAAGKGDDEGRRLAEYLCRLPEEHRRALYLADWHVPDAEHRRLAWASPDAEDEPEGDAALQAEIDRRGLLIEEQERELNRLRAELQGRAL